MEWNHVTLVMERNNITLVMENDITLVMDWNNITLVMDWNITLVMERNNITLVMVVIIVMFLATQTPAYVNQLLYYFLAETRYQCGDAYFYYYHLSNLVVSSNSALNFVVYCVCRRNFRRRLATLCGRGGTDGSPECSRCQMSPDARFRYDR